MSLEKKINQREGEEIVAVVRQYGLVFWWSYLLGFVCLLLSAFFIVWLLSQGILGMVTLGLGILLGIYIIFRTWFFQSHNMFVLTTLRVVDVNRRGWFDELVSSAMYNDIKDIFLHRQGILASMFGYAKVVIETKSQRSLLELEAVHHPEKVIALILEESDKAEEIISLGSKKAIYEKFIKIIPSLSEEELCEVEDMVGLQLSRLDKVIDAGVGQDDNEVV